MAFPTAVYVDPTAGVTLFRRGPLCGRCGLPKGIDARPGICRDCAVVVGQRVAKQWNAAA